MVRDAVLVTGTSSGLGLEAAVYLAGRGFRVYATMRDLSRRDVLDAEAARRGVHLSVLRLDVTDGASIESAVETILAECGGIYALVNNAGINTQGYFEDVSEDEVRGVYEVNVFGTMALTRAVLPHMRRARRGRIVILSSVGGKIAAPSASPYCSSKFALEGFGESLAQEMAPFGVYVSLAEPGSVPTELFGRNRLIAARALDPDGPYRQWFLRLQELTEELGRTPAATAEDVAKAICRALTSRRPRLRYVVGRRTWAAITLRRYLPGELFERIAFGELMRRVTRGQRPKAPEKGEQRTRRVGIDRGRR